MMRRLAVRGASNASLLNRGATLRRFPGVVSEMRSFHGATPLRKDEEPLPPTLTEKYKLDDPTRYVPLTVAGFSLGTLTGLYHIDGETQLLALWVLFCGVCYTRGGPIISEMFEEMAAQIEAEQKKSEDAEAAAISSALEAHRANANIYQDVEKLFSGYGQLVGDLSASSEGRLKRAVREQYVKRLDNLLAVERKVTEAMEKELVEAATQYVTSAYTTDKGGVKAKALDAAIAALASPEGAKKDATVTALYGEFFKSVQSSLAKSKGQTVELSDAELADIKEELEPMARKENLDINSIKFPKKITL